MGLGWALGPMADVFMWERRGRFSCRDTEAQTWGRRALCWWGQRVGGWGCAAAGSQTAGIASSDQKLLEAGKDSWDLEREQGPADALILDFRPPELWEEHISVVKPPGLWYFVMAFLGKSWVLLTDTGIKALRESVTCFQRKTSFFLGISLQGLRVVLVFGIFIIVWVCLHVCVFWWSVYGAREH